MNFSGVPPPFSVPSCNCPESTPCVEWGYTQNMAVLGVGSALFGVCAAFGLICLLNKYNVVFPRMKRITSFKLNTIPEERV